MTAAENPCLAVGAYVLHALPPAEEAAFEEHLAGRDGCTWEVAALEATVACLAEAEAVTPPAALRRQVLDRIAAIGQEHLGDEVPAPERAALKQTAASSGGAD
ncbi:zf-HC2 domain-containing protein [Streptomyces decoyicus]|uniref:zf-HC2 domain-containing protein n=1 Tax=Streptomyces decoyicus TaxID=249567 RepID=UPI002E19A90C